MGVLTGNALTSSDYVVIIAQSSFLSIKGLQTIIEIVEDVQETINEKIEVVGFVITQVNRTVVRREMSETLREAYPEKVFQSEIRQTVAIEEATTQQTDIFTYDPDSAGAQDYKALAEEIIQRIENSTRI